MVKRMKMPALESARPRLEGRPQTLYDLTANFNSGKTCLKFSSVRLHHEEWSATCNLSAKLTFNGDASATKRTGWIHGPRILLFRAVSPVPAMQPDLSNNVNLRDAKFELRSAWTGVASGVWKTQWVFLNCGCTESESLHRELNPFLAKPADSLVCAPAASQGPLKKNGNFTRVSLIGCLLWLFCNEVEAACSTAKTL